MVDPVPRRGIVPPATLGCSCSSIHRRYAATLVSTSSRLGPQAGEVVATVTPATAPATSSGPPESPGQVPAPPRSARQQTTALRRYTPARPRFAGAPATPSLPPLRRAAS